MHTHLLCGCARDGSFICEDHRQKIGGVIVSLVSLLLFFGMVFVWAAIFSGA